MQTYMQECSEQHNGFTLEAIQMSFGSRDLNCGSVCIMGYCSIRMNEP